MGCYGEEEVCELAGLYLLNKLVPLVGTKNVVLYRNDGLAVIHQANGPEMDHRIKKYTIALLQPQGLSITIDTKLIETDFLDVSFNLKMDKCFPYRKPNNTLSTSVLSQTIHHPSPNNCHR